MRQGEAAEELGSITTTPHPSILHHMNGTINGTEQRPGIVTAISPDIVTVQIQQQSACSGCHARDLCVSSECREHQLQLKTYGQHFSIGEQVLVVARRSVGRLAVLLAFVLPLLLLVLTLSIAQTFLALSEAAAVLVAIGLLSSTISCSTPSAAASRGASSSWWSPSPRTTNSTLPLCISLSSS